MRQKFVVSLFLVAFAPLAVSQDIPSGGYSSGAQTNQSADCSDPTLANTSFCQGTSQTQTSSEYPSSQTGSISGGNNNPNPQPSTQSGMSRGLTYNDLGTNYNYVSSLNRQPLPPQPLTEFQKFVAGTTGEILPIFGADLFQYAPSTFSPVDNTPVPPDYIIGPGDELRIRIWGQVNFNANVMVDRAGEINLPQVGQVHVAGLPFQALTEHLRTAIGRVFRNFDLTADIGQIRAVQVYIVGQAHRPGTYTVSSLTTLVDALFTSGGPSVLGSMRHIYLKRGGNTVVDFDLYDLLVNGDKSKDARLESGDVIDIPPVGPQVAITGSVVRSAIYELRDENNVDQLLKYAGGQSTTASDARISIERIHDRQDRITMEIPFDQQGLATVLRQGDILRVLAIVPQYQNTVTLRGNVANPGRFAWHEGMHISDLIPDKDSLLTRDYWWKRAQLGLPAPEFEPIPALEAHAQPSYPIDLRSRVQNLPLNPALCSAISGSNNLNCNPSATGNAGYAGNGSNQNQNGAAPLAQNGQSAQPGTQYIGGAGTQGPQSQLAASQSASSQTLAARQAQVVTENTAGSAPRLRVALPAAELDWNYAVVERLDKITLKTSLIPFDLGKLIIDHDQSQNIELQPGDIVTIFSQADIHVPIAQQTKFVRLEGEFVHAGTYSVQPGETLPELVARAGGFTPGAYLYGSEFTRESTRLIQQQRIDEYIQNLQLEITRGTVAQTSSAASTGQDIAAANAAVSTEQTLISRLQQIRATGRIVLELKPASTEIASLPPLQLEDGDTFIVPSVPAGVNVVGSVYDQNSFIYFRGRRVGDYLHLAGGPNRDADFKHAFIIRADGSVLSRESANGVWGNTFLSIAIHPGDTLVVPEKIYRPGALRGFLDYSQLFSQLAFGAAAFSVIF